MIEESIYDLWVEELLERQRLVRGELKKRFKKTKPFRMEPMSREETLYNDSQITPEMKMSLRQSMGDDVMDDYEFEMQNLRGKE